MIECICSTPPGCNFLIHAFPGLRCACPGLTSTVLFEDDAKKHPRRFCSCSKIGWCSTPFQGCFFFVYAFPELRCACSLRREQGKRALLKRGGALFVLEEDGGG